MQQDEETQPLLPMASKPTKGQAVSAKTVGWVAAVAACAVVGWVVGSARTSPTTAAATTTLASTHARSVRAVTRERQSLDVGWKISDIGANSQNCSADTFPINMNDQQCFGLHFQGQVVSEEGCRQICCGDNSCEVWQWCPQGAACSDGSNNNCWTGLKSVCSKATGWISQAREKLPSPTPVPTTCGMEECQVGFDDSKWRSVDVPHDFVVEGTFSPHADMVHGYLPFGSAWYRRHFDLPASWKSMVTFIEFDGTQRDSWVYLNGHLIATHASGYTSYRAYFDASVANFGGSNVLAVHIDATKPDGWWYDGGGIYRHVWLNAVPSVHIAPWGVYVPSTVAPDTIRLATGAHRVPHAARVLTGQAQVLAEVSVVNSGASDVDVTLVGTLKEASTGTTAGTTKSAQTTIKAGTNASIALEPLALEAQLWSLDNPFLYAFTTQVMVGGNVVDETDTTTGIRAIRFDAAQGFLLNEQRTKIQGMANHQDFCGVGVAVPDSLQVYRVQRMKEMGANAWRTAHNPPNPELLDECDRQGMLVWDENHRNRADEQPWISDLESLILRDRNHPSVIIWSLCNEVLCENFNTTAARALKPIVQRLDPRGNRPVSAAMNGGYDGDFRDVLDLMGVNYHVSDYDQLHKRNTSQPMIGSETSSDVSDRGVYFNSDALAYVSAYDVNYPSWGNTAEDGWCPILERDWMSGGFVWTGFDYKGEPTPYQWPNVNSHFGIIDICGFPKDNYYYYQSVWLPTDTPVLHVFPHWNWTPDTCLGGCTISPDGTMKVDVWVYSNLDTVELFLNGKSLGSQSMPTSNCRHVNWTVEYAPGTLTAHAHNTNAGPSTSRLVHEVKASVQTTGSAAALELHTEFPSSGEIDADGTSVALVTVRAVDSGGLVVPTAAFNVTFSLEGPGKIVGLGNGDPSSHEPDKPTSFTMGVRSVWNGLARVVVQAADTAGTITLTASANGVSSASLAIKST